MVLALLSIRPTSSEASQFENYWRRDPHSSIWAPSDRAELLVDEIYR
jgi:hypothetical protein